MDGTTLVIILLMGLVWAILPVFCCLEGLKLLNKKDEHDRRQPVTVGLGLLLLFAAGLSLVEIIEFFRHFH